MKPFPLWAARLYNSPIALDRMKNETLCQFAEQRIIGARVEGFTVGNLEPAQIRAFADEASVYGEAGRKPFAHRGNIAVLQVRGTLVHKGDFMDAASGLVGYNTILAQARAASLDPDIKGMFIAYASGGGEVAGMFAAAEELATMSQAEGGKPIYAYLDEHACSAAYVLASASDKIFGRRESMGGSIAALINMVDKSKAYEKLGLTPVVVRASWADRKARGQDGEPIDEELIAKAQAMVDDASEMIVEFVAAMRGVDEQAIRDLRGEVFGATDLAKMKLIDGIASEQEVFARLEKVAARV